MSVDIKRTGFVILFTLILFGGVYTNQYSVSGVPISEHNEPFSLILMIGDGMGFSHTQLARLVEFGESGNLTMEQAPYRMEVETYSADDAETDSAAAATAMATGAKTNNGMLSITPNGTILETILEQVQKLDKATGIVATSNIQHATPAAFMAHVASRNSVTEITRQIVEESQVDVLLGGGSLYLSTSQLETMQSQGYSIVENRNDMLEANTSKILGLFADRFMDYEMERNYTLTPSIAEMTSKSIEILSQDPDGFFLMVEGSRIDHAAHANDKVGTALDAIAFDEAVRVALDFVLSHDNCALVVTADHETGGLTIINNSLSSTLPADVLSEEDKRTLRIDRVQNVTVNWNTTYHSAANVPLFYFGPEITSMVNHSIIDNTDIYDYMWSHFSSEPVSLTSSVATTTSGSVTTSTSETSTTTPFQLDTEILILGASVIGVLCLSFILVVLYHRKSNT